MTGGKIKQVLRSGQRYYLATRILLQLGFEARNLSGGFLSRALSAEYFDKEIPRCAPASP